MGVYELLQLGLSLLIGVGIGAIAAWQVWSRINRQKDTQKTDNLWLNYIYEHAELGMNLTSPKGYLLRVNQAYCDLFGYSRIDLLSGMRWQDLTHPDDREVDEGFVQKIYWHQMPAFALEKRCFRKDGTLIWVKIHASPVYDPQGIVQCIAAVVEDVSRHKAEQLALERSEQELRAMFASMTDVVLILNQEGRYLKVTAPSNDLLLRPGDELLGQTLHDVFPQADADHILESVQQVLTTGNVVYLEYPVEVNDKTLWFAANMSPLSADSVICVAREISDRHQAELALRHSEATNRAILESIPDLLLRFHQDGTCLDVVENKQCKSIATRSSIGRTVDEIIPADLAQRRMRAIAAALETQTLQVYEQRIMVNGTMQDEEVRVIAINEEETLVMVRDIGDRKRAERVMHQQANVERALNQVTQAIRHSLDATTIYTTAVREFAHVLEAQQAVLTEYCPTQHLWRNIAFYHETPDAATALGFEIPDENNPIADQIKQGEIVCLANAEVCQDPANQVLATQFPGSWLILPIHFLEQVWGGLTLVRSHSLWQDTDIQLAQAITSQLAIAIQQAELYQQLQQLNQQLERQVEERTAVIQKTLTFESLLKRITDKVRDSLDENQILQTAVKELGIGLEVICCNASVYNAELTSCRIAHEYTIQESFGLGLEVSFDVPNVQPIVSQLKQAQTLQVCFPKQEFAPLHEDYYAILMCPLLDDQGILGDLWLFRPKDAWFSDQEIRLVQQVANHCAIALRQSRLYQAAQTQVDELARLNQLKDDFLSTVSHELRTPMSNIKMATQMLEIYLQSLIEGMEDSDRINIYLNILQEECNRETQLINDLLDLSRLDAGSEPLVVSVMDLTHWLPHIAEVFTERTRLAQQDLILELEQPLPSLTTDFIYLERVLMELLHNACKYTPPGEIIKIKATSVEAESLARQPLTESPITIQVSNSGVEIPSEELSHVFDKFYRVPNHDPWKHGGTGLGLALVKKRVERIEGTIAVTSGDNWTTFTLQLPDLSHLCPLSSPFAYSWTHAN